MSKEQKITEVAARLGVPAQWLDALIRFETAGTYSTTIKNPYSSARGLIQIIDASAQDLGFRDSLDAVTKNQSFDSQMDNVVYPYLKRYAPFKNKQAFYMSVFYPAYRNRAPDTTFSASIQKVNPGIKTVRDYVEFVDRKAGLAKVKKSLPLMGLILTGAGVYYFLRYKKQ